MDYIVHGVRKSWTRLSDFHFHSSSQMVLVLKNSPANAGDRGDAGLIPRLDQRRSPREGHGNLLQYSCLENPMDRGAWRTIVLGVTNKSDMTEHTCATPVWRTRRNAGINISCLTLE